MSGIFGYVSESLQPETARVLERMAERLRHLNHYQSDTAVIGEGVGVGRVQIGIFNQEPQPVSDRDGTVRLWLTGEFYHQAARRRSYARRGLLGLVAPDAELALAAYLDAGIDGLTDLDGAFSILVWDGRTGQLVFVNDRYGLYPHYYAEFPGGFVFAPELKALSAAPEFQPRLDSVAVAQYVRFQQLLGDTSWLEGARLIPPAAVLRYRLEERRLETRRYWDWGDIPEAPLVTFGEAVEEADRLFRRAIDAQIAGRHRVGVYLSGGNDSRTILGFIRGQVPVQTVTYGQPGCRDVLYAAQIAKRAGSRHHWFPLQDGRWVEHHAPLHLALTEGNHSWLHMHGMSTLGAARRFMDVNLTGWDGGTILYGRLDDYGHDHRYREPASWTELRDTFYESFQHHFHWPGLQETEARAVLDTPWGRPLRPLAHESFSAELERYRNYRRERQADFFYLDQHCRRSTQNMVVFTRSALEVRCPFFDYDLVRFIYSLPATLIANERFVRAFIATHLPELGAVPNERDELPPGAGTLARQFGRGRRAASRRVRSRLPGGRAEHPRLYADYEEYLRTDLRAWAESLLFERRTLERGLFETAAVRALWERHLTGRELWTVGKIAPLIEVERVARALIDQEPIRYPAGTQSLPS